MKSVEIRQAFIDFFKSKDHHVVPASPVVPTNDPTLLFTNAGMNQFKPYFLGTNAAPFPRAVNSQPCIRVSGKHNDLEDVGLDTYHHTSFEMLGNWSFGDYYKKEAIIWAWELLTEVYQLPKDHLVVTVFDDDDEAFDLWASVTDIHHHHIVRCGKKDNFWEMGATGPCGPCSEIHLDLSPDGPAEIQRDPTTGGLSNRYMELWNLVFIQFDRQSNGELMDLPNRHVDTGAGLERLSAQLQGVRSNYDTDCFHLLIKRIEDVLGIPYQDGDGGTPHRVIADHIRTVCFGIADNVIPSNDGRGYVLRRLIRRALRFASQAGKADAFLHDLVPLVDESLGSHYPQIQARMRSISTLIESEEQQFLRTVESGLKLFHQVTIEMNASKTTTIPGEMAFKLYDTYGFPLDLTEVMAREASLTVDVEGFDRALNAQRERSRAARSEDIDDGRDEGIQAIGRFIGDVHHGVYVDQPGGGEARLPVNDAQRFGLAQHHTATHLLHEGLRQILGAHVQQSGSMVDVNRLRFDFSYGSAIQNDELHAIERFVNDCITAGHSVSIAEEALDSAKARGAHAMFGEKYGERVRVVEIPNISIELCGGNHVTNTSDLQTFAIVSEGAVAAGIRRIEALVGNERVDDHMSQVQRKAYNDYSKRWELVVQNAASAGLEMPQKLDATASIDRIQQAQGELLLLGKTLDKAIKADQHTIASDLFDAMIDSSIPMKASGGVAIFQVLEDQPVPVLRAVADRVVNALNDCVVVLGSSMNGKAHAVAKVSKSMTGTITATDLIDALTSITGGGGGGKPTMAQAGGCNAEKLSDGMNHITNTYAKTTARD